MNPLETSSFAAFRLKTEVGSIQLLPGASLSVVRSGEEKYIAEVEYTMLLSEGIYEGRVLRFKLKIPNAYPFKPPKLLCLDNVFHPNVDDDGNVCMEILRLGWRPSHGLESIFVNLYVIFVEVTGEDALNTKAGDLFKSDYEGFVRAARSRK
ncbi:UBIQUITIN CONJUGATING ENZYME E2-20K [Encephalitozoon cuniculi GB-M1]|uniref:UBIQUITIN CONJUGATING ENZYME E2-20K n=2 Tax=Encephalitozoon cuniculi TaxID=6035 RepID=Q8SR07_ENCCU|nr:ubiquitin-protein ligase [Encephalitozoon cuniculi GB-M1]AGE96189.1 ubiquitin conjugating enzyme e2-20k [Encephalitozoon cuniculi]KMV65307.1 ubiquitin-protein ligase [Encephalitozoon cuniculi EcunIII-L]UYI26619.1 ubiquitin conjugating enzyme E2 [Encephalitozoon cuniculi]CAD25874.1 UBIQUITIN CONJUGATING ENZYME E2-20K [Encephalitozoon cuniculi GB-M1]